MQIGRILGIPLRIDWSWLLVFALLVWSLSSRMGPLGAIPAQWRVAAAAVTALAFFASVIAHELAHAVVAKRFGIRTSEIVLFVFGGVSRMERVGMDPASEAKIAAAGPALSILLGAMLGTAAFIFSTDVAAARILTYLAIINVVLGVFNLIPAYPVDGGRIVHAIAWRFTGKRARASTIAVAASTATGFLLASGGVALLLAGFVVSGAWTMLIAWFILRMAQAEYLADTRIEPLEAMRCGDLADPPGMTMQPDTLCNEALGVMAASGRRAIPITVGKRFIGLVTLTDLAKIAGRDGGAVYVSSVMTPVEKLATATPGMSAFEALKKLADSSFRQLPVVSESGELVGFVTNDTIRRAIAFTLERGRIGAGV